ncbi:hypothetical protein [Candidatus Magnetominusculus dajiuhuensis]|uniref:hypothetical protein n=1 Tax=Candidatus Magnetominusculus dajiuhuensis TaxID=3137712 RepID=UPI003B434C40
MRNWKTTAVGVLSIAYGIMTVFGWGVIKNPDAGVTAIITGLGLILAKDAGNKM